VILEYLRFAIRVLSMKCDHPSLTKGRTDTRRDRPDDGCGWVVPTWIDWWERTALSVASDRTCHTWAGDGAKD
jgi:hypothetical protein